MGDFRGRGGVVRGGLLCADLVRVGGDEYGDDVTHYGMCVW
jgi:hypothetical protein